MSLIRATEPEDNEAFMTLRAVLNARRMWPLAELGKTLPSLDDDIAVLPVMYEEGDEATRLTLTRNTKNMIHISFAHLSHGGLGFVSIRSTHEKLNNVKPRQGSMNICMVKASEAYFRDQTPMPYEIDHSVHEVTHTTHTHVQTPHTRCITSQMMRTHTSLHTTTLLLTGLLPAYGGVGVRSAERAARGH
jgi:hypothetical protein